MVTSNEIGIVRMGWALLLNQPIACIFYLPFKMRKILTFYIDRRSKIFKGKIETVALNTMYDC